MIHTKAAPISSILCHYRMKCALPKTNKRFLDNLVLGTMASNRQRSRPKTEPRSKDSETIEEYRRREYGSGRAGKRGRDESASRTPERKRKREGSMEKVKESSRKK